MWLLDESASDSSTSYTHNEQHTSKCLMQPAGYVGCRVNMLWISSFESIPRRFVDDDNLRSVNRQQVIPAMCHIRQTELVQSAIQF